MIALARLLFYSKMSSRETDRHKTPRVYKSGYEKSKERKEKKQKDDKLLAQTRRVTDFFSTNQNNVESVETSVIYVQNEEIEDQVSKCI